MDKVFVLFGSQTGNAEWIAKSIHKEILNRGFSSVSFSMEEYQKVDFSPKNLLILVVSNTGDGDPPDNALAFFKFLRQHKGDAFKGQRYTILGLGDTNYSNFNNTAKRMDRKLHELGAISVYPKGLADDAVGLELVVDPWIEGLYPVVSSLFTKTQEEKTATNNLDLLGLIKELSLDNLTNVTRIPTETLKLVHLTTHATGSATIFEAPKPKFDLIKSRILKWRCLTSAGAVKRVIQLSLDDVNFVSPGDSISVICSNKDREVLDLIQRIGYSPDHMFDVSEGSFHFETPCSIFDALKFYFEIRSYPRKAFLRMLAEYCMNPEEKNVLLFLVSRQGLEQYRKFEAKRPSILDILRELPSCTPPLDRLLENMAPLNGRPYSIVSAVNASIVFSLTAPPGLCTGWLDELLGHPEDKEWKSYSSPLFLPVHPRPSNHFKPPNNPVPLIMIGPGTGVCPFIGFLEYWESLIDRPKAWLFTGFRNKSLDYLFETELNGFLDRNILTLLTVAFSRDDESVYVQEKIREQGETVAKWIVQDNASVFVCGDAVNMAKQVNQALTEILDASGIDGKTYLDEMVQAHRYVRDIWG